MGLLNAVQVASLDKEALIALLVLWAHTRLALWRRNQLARLALLVPQPSTPQRQKRLAASQVGFCSVACRKSVFSLITSMCCCAKLVSSKVAEATPAPIEPPAPAPAEPPASAPALAPEGWSLSQATYLMLCTCFYIYPYVIAMHKRLHLLRERATNSNGTMVVFMVAS